MRYLFLAVECVLGAVVAIVFFMIAAPVALIKCLADGWRALVIKYHYDGDRDAYDRDQWKDN